jgi:hypothetical protein
MDMYDSLFSPSSVLNEQVARQLFEVLPDGGPIMVIMDREGNFWPSDSEEFTKLNISHEFLVEFCDKIDDGDEPVVTQIDDFSIIAAQLATEKTNCGYVVLALPKYSPESTLINIDLIEIVINQVNLVARLIEKNNIAYEFQLKQASAGFSADGSLN